LTEALEEFIVGKFYEMISWTNSYDFGVTNLIIKSVTKMLKS